MPQVRVKQVKRQKVEVGLPVKQGLKQIVQSSMKIIFQS